MQAVVDLDDELQVLFSDDPDARKDVKALKRNMERLHKKILKRSKSKAGDADKGPHQAKKLIG